MNYVLLNSFLNVDEAKVPMNGPIRPNEHWKILFEFYNTKNEKRLGLGCMSCYIKVYQFCKNELLKQCQKALATDTEFVDKMQQTANSIGISLTKVKQ